MNRVRLNEQGELVQFSGFSPEAFGFLRRIKRNNRREWFLPRKPLYESLLRDPMEALLEEVLALMRKKHPEVRFDPRKSIHRIYRDIRFSADKSPYKTHIGASPSFMGRPRGEDPGFYLHIAPGEVFTAGGIYSPSAEQLRKIRRRIDESPKPFLRVVQDAGVRRKFGGVKGDSLKRNPKGFAPDHPRIEYLRLTQLYLYEEFDERAAKKPDFADKVARSFSKMIPLMRWLTEALR